MNIYDENGYVAVKRICAIGMPFNFFVSQRGSGKTYPVLKMVKEDDTRFMFMRRTQSQTDIIVKPELSPFKTLNSDFNWHIECRPITKYNSGFYDADNDDKLIGMSAALSTFANLRGFDASDMDKLIYDEFVPQRTERPIRGEGEAFLNAYETMNRNRELKGKKPIQAIALGNANNMANDIFIELGLVGVAEKMKRNHQEFYLNNERGICIVMPDKSPISELKKETALYKLTGTKSAFARMALNNEFSSDDIGNVKSRPIVEYKPLVGVGELFIYEHKSTRRHYVSTFNCGSFPNIYGSGIADRERFKHQYFWLWDEYIDNTLEFEEYLCEVLLTKIFK